MAKKKSDNRLLGKMTVGKSLKKDSRTIKVSRVVQDIIERCNLQQVKLNTAIIGYDIVTGIPIYDLNLIIDTLIAYGYDADSSMDFATIIALNSKKDGTNVIISQSDKFLHIYLNIKPIPEVVKLIADNMQNKD